MADLICSRLLRLLRRQKIMSRARRIRRARPPITPPTMDPIGAPLESFDEPGVFVGKASAGGSTWASRFSKATVT